MIGRGTRDRVRGHFANFYITCAGKVLSKQGHLKLFQYYLLRTPSVQQRLIQHAEKWSACSQDAGRHAGAHAWLSIIRAQISQAPAGGQRRGLPPPPLSPLVPASRSRPNVSHCNPRAPPRQTHAGGPAWKNGERRERDGL